MADLSISVESPIHAGPLGAATAIPVAGPAKAKVDELFCRWLAMPDTASLVNGWIEELQAGKTIVPPKATHTSLRTPTSRSAPVSPSRSAATGYTPPLSPSRFGTRQSPVQQRFGFGDDGSPGMGKPGGALSPQQQGVFEPFPSLAAAAAVNPATAEFDGATGLSPSALSSPGKADSSAASTPPHGQAASRSAPSPGGSAGAASSPGILGSQLSSSMASPNSVRVATEAAAAAAAMAGKVSTSASLIPRFYVKGEGGRGRGRPIEQDKLETRLETIVSTWRTHWLEARKQALVAARDEGREAPQLEGIESAPSVEHSPQEHAAGVDISAVDADLGLPVEQFAAVAKTLCGFPSFFAAPLFRRIRKLFGRASKGVAVGMDADAAREAAKEARLAAMKHPGDASSSASSSSSSSSSSAAAAAAGGKGADGSSESKEADADAPASLSRAPSLIDRLPFASSPSLGCPVSHVDIVKGDEDAEDDSAGRDIPAQGYDDDTRGVIRLRTFMRFWRSEIEPLDQFGRFFNLVAQREVITVGPHKRTRAIVSADFMPYLEELLAFHPGLAFLESTPEFQEKYARTVVARIMFELDTQGTAAITERALRRSDLLHAFHTVDMEEDINAVTRFFSYEHFYVLYCKFWELDSDHDFFLSRDNLNALPDLTHVLLDRVFAGAGRVSTGGTPGKMGYEDFVCFFLAEEDKTSETAIRYWFKVCDVDGDRVITPPDVAYFYKHQLARMQELGNEPVKLDDIITQMSDLLKPDVPGHFELKDFLEPTRSKLTGVFFSTLFNLSKFQQFEAKDAVVVKQELNTSGITQWDRYASVEYMRLAEEEEEDEAAGAAVLTGAGSGMGGAMEMADNSRAGWSG